MSKLKSTLIKLSAVMLALSVSFAIWLMPNGNEVKASDTSFGIVSTSIRNNEDKVYGLQFTTNVSADWFTQHASDKYSFGTLVAPADRLNETFDPTASANANMNAMEDADNIIVKPEEISAKGFEYSASIVFDRAVVENHIIEKGWDATVDEVLNKLYKYDFVAIPYASYKSGEYTKFVYAEPYVANMYETAVLTYAKGVTDKNEEWKSIAEIYLGIGKDDVYSQKAAMSVKDNLLTVDDKEFAFAETDVIVIDGKIITNNNGFTVDVDGNITLQGEFTANRSETKTVIVFRETDVTVIDLYVADNVLRTTEDANYFFDKTIWVDGATHYSEITVLGNDIDMSGIILPRTTGVSFSGTFDGRGHVISNLTKIMGETNNNESNGLFGEIVQNSNAIIRNVAFDNIKSTTRNINQGLLINELRCTLENIYVKYNPNSENQQLFRDVRDGVFRNSVIEIPYDPDFDKDKFIANNYNYSPLTRLFYRTNSNVVTNVQVISQAPIVRAEDNLLTTDVAYTDGVVTNWYSYFVYGENETEVWYKYPYFTRATDDPSKPGLGLADDEITVQNTLNYVDGVPTSSLTAGKSRIWKGVYRYDTIGAMMADEDNADNVQALINTGMWKMENGKLVWAKGENVTTYIAGEYEAAENKLMSTALNGEVIKKITVNGVELSLENKEYTVDENGYLTSIYAKKSATDTKNGISYKVNSPDNDILDDVILYTETGKYQLCNVNYWTKVIDDEAELKQVLDIDYAVVATTTSTRESSNGIVYSVSSGSEYVFNAGIYKLGSDIDMANVVLNYNNLGVTFTTSTVGGVGNYTKIVGGFSGTFDGDGHVINNFTPNKFGMFGVLATSKSGVTLGARIKNVAFINVVDKPSVSTNTNNFTPLIATHISTQEGYQQRLSNIYITYSESSTGVSGIMTTPTEKLYLNNIYIVNEKVYDAISSSTYDRYKFEGDFTFDSNKYYKNFFGRDYTGTLFTTVARMTEGNTADFVNDVYVASPTPLAYSHHCQGNSHSAYMYANPVTKNITVDPMSKGRYYPIYKITAYQCSGCSEYFSTQACANGCEGATFTSASKSAVSYYRSYAFAGNETGESLPLITAVSPSLINELKENVAKVYPLYYTNNAKAYPCSKCNKYAALIKGGACYDPNCDGTYTKTSVAIYTDPRSYIWSYIDVQNLSSTDVWSESNAAVKFEGVTKYDTVAEMEQNVDFKASNFATNKYWKVTDDGKLYWASLYV